MTSDWYEPDLTLRERLIARASALAVLVALIALWARLIWLWRLGAIKSEPFFGSPEWNLAIVLPGATILAAAARVRLLWRTYERFAWHASVDWPVTAEGVRQALVLYSIRDQCTDARDEVVGLSELRDKARESGIDFATLAREVADLSDDTRRDPMFGSTRQLILRSAVEPS